MRLVIDIREFDKRAESIEKYFSTTRISCSREQLPICDYVGYDDNNKVLFGVEYKTYEDFTSSIVNGHLTSQLTDMEQVNNPYLFIVGNYKTWVANPVHCNIKLEHITGYLTSSSAKFKTKIIMLENNNQAERALKKLFEIYYDSDTTQVQLPERKKRTGNPSLDMYLSVPGIGKSKGLSYSKIMKFSDFVTICKYDNEAKATFKAKGITVSQTIIDYVKLC